MTEYREAARIAALERKPNWVAAGVIAAVWLFLLLVIVLFIAPRLK